MLGRSLSDVTHQDLYQKGELTCSTCCLLTSLLQEQTKRAAELEEGRTGSCLLYTGQYCRLLEINMHCSSQ